MAERESMQDRLTQLGEKVVKLRDGKNMKWHEIAGEVKTSQGKAMLAYMFVTTPDKERINAKNDEDLAAKIVKARDEKNMSWGKISAAAGIPEGKAKKLWETVTGKSASGNRIGKGGRHPGDGSETKVAAPQAKTVSKTSAKAKAAEAKAKAAAKTTKAVKKTTTKAEPKPRTKKAKVDLLTADLDTLVELMDGRKIKVQNSVSGKDTVYAVKTVKSADEKNIVIIDSHNGSERTFARDAIKAVTGR